MLEQIKNEINDEIDSKLVKFNQKILQINETGYGKKEILLGVRTPIINKIAKKYYKKLSYEDINILLQDKIHEYKLFAIKVLLLKNEFESQKVVAFYQKNMKYLTNWDLIDVSASKILGKYLYSKTDDEIIEYAKELGRSKSFWYRRISIVMLHYLILNDKIDVCLKHYVTLLDDKESLVQKALGWMLREIGKKDKITLISFLKEHRCSNICFSYATEHFTKIEKELLKVKYQ